MPVRATHSADRVQIPKFTALPFDCLIEPHDRPAVGSITHVAREGWSLASEHYVVDVQINGRSFRFTIGKGAHSMWQTRILSVLDGQTVANVYTFQYSNKKIEYLFEEALTNLAIFDEPADDGEDE